MSALCTLFYGFAEQLFPFMHHPVLCNQNVPFVFLLHPSVSNLWCLRSCLKEIRFDSHPETLRQTWHACTCPDEHPQDIDLTAATCGPERQGVGGRDKHPCPLQASNKHIECPWLQLASQVQQYMFVPLVQPGVRMEDYISKLIQDQRLLAIFKRYT